MIVVPGLPLVTRGPYRRLRHPNYVAVVAEIVALPLVHTAWVTALVVHRRERRPARGPDPGRERGAGDGAGLAGRSRSPRAPRAATMAGWTSTCSSSVAGRSGWAPRSRRRWPGCRSRSSSAARAPVDKACGEGLMPAAPRVAAPARGRAGRRASSAASATSARGRTATAHFSAAAPGSASGARRCRPRSAARADALGVKRVPGGAAAAGDRAGLGRGGRGAARAGCVAADGLHSPVRRALGLDVAGAGGAVRYGLRRHYRVAPWSDLVEVHWADDAEAYVTPVAAGPRRRRRARAPAAAPYDAWLARFPALAERLAGAGAGVRRPRRRDRCAGRRPAGCRAGCCSSGTRPGTSTRSPARASRSGSPCARELVGCLVAGRPQDYEARLAADDAAVPGAHRRAALGGRAGRRCGATIVPRPRGCPGSSAGSSTSSASGAAPPGT